jgi:hypothetical protein
LLLSAPHRHPQGANHQLREALRDALGELESTRTQLQALQALQQRLRDGAPGGAALAEAASEQERAEQAERDAAVLHLLRSKVGCGSACNPTTPRLAVVFVPRVAQQERCAVCVLLYRMT